MRVGIRVPGRHVRAGRVALPAICALLLVSVSCASRSQQDATALDAAASVQKNELAQTTIVSPDEAIGVDELLVRAAARIAESKLDAAEADYRLLLLASARDVAPTAKQQAQALFGLGTIADLRGQSDEALAFYQRAIGQHPGGKLETTAKVRVVRLLVFSERYLEAGEQARKTDTLGCTVNQRLALLVAQTLERLAVGDRNAAARLLSAGRTLVEEHRLDQVTVPSLDVAALYFALGEYRRLEALEIGFSPLPENFSEQLERRCQFILDAQGAYSRTMRSRDAHWSAMAGIRVGELFKRLHEDLMTIEVPVEGPDQRQQKLFEGAMRLRYSILLVKAERMMSTTVEMLDRTKEPSRWREKAQKALNELREAREMEEQALDALPYSREQLQRVLEDLDRKHGGVGQI